MKPIPIPLLCTLRTLLWLAVIGLCVDLAQASPYASAVTNDNGVIKFIMNEGGATVSVVFEDNTTNVLGVLPKGPASFPLGTHTSFQIICVKAGNGVAELISSDSYTNSVWNSPRGVAVNKNPKIGHLFGRIYTGNSAAGGTVGTTWKGKGLYAMNPDQTDATGQSTNALGTGAFAASGANGPWRIRVAPDNSLLVCDFSTPGAALYQFQPDLGDSNLVLSIIGQTAAVAAGIHGDFFGTPLMTGSLAEGNLVLWTADSGMPAPATATLGPGTSAGSYNCLFRYDIGAGPLPWNQPPNYAYTLGLDGIAELRTEIDLGRDGKIIGGFGRANLSNGNIQILDPTGATKLYDSLAGSSDPWNGINGSRTQGGTYGGVRVSPDGRFLASVDINNGITIATLTNGIPDEGSIFGIQNTPSTANSRGMDWDAAANLYVISSGQGLLRVYSLGNSSTCITSNDWTGTNGTFQFVLPSVTASVVVKQPEASQNYINNSTPGTPTPGVFTISLDKHHLDQPVTVNFVRSGTATYPSNYTMLIVTNAHGVVLGTNSVTFPAGDYPGGSGGWSADVQIIPTAAPVSGPTLTVGLRVSGGPSYLAGTPGSGTLTIANTGPQMLLLTAAASGGTMYRGTPNDSAKFVITRWGDTNGPGNSPGNITPLAYTVTNVSYFGTAQYPLDYRAQAQVFVPNQVPQDGSSAIVINPGEVALTCLVGNPVAHTDLSLPPTNLTIVLNLTNAAVPPANTNLLSLEGLPYQVNTASVTLTELDNAVGPESVVFYSNPLTEAADSSNWTLTFASTNLGGTGNTVLPVVIANYNNNSAGNDFDVKFGAAVADDNVPPSPTMAAKGWTRALRLTVNKNAYAPAGVNVYPQGKDFKGNYALRFDMYLSMYALALNNAFIGATWPREFALFGINHFGTNCNWRTTSVPAVPAGTGCGTTNADGVWFAVDAGAGSISPADFDAFTTPALPNSGITADLVSAGSSTAAGAQVVSGIFKHPPFDVINPASLGGQPINKWVNVSVEVTRQTNCTLYMNQSPIFSFVLTNVPASTTVPGRYTNGTIMLGYLDPVGDVSDNTAFTYFSNVRVVELSPYITNAPVSMIITQGQNISLTSGANLATAPVTHIWYRGTTNNLGTPTVALQTNTADASWIASTLSVDNLQAGTNFMAVFSDAAGSVTSTVAIVEVIQGPTNASVTAGSTFAFRITPIGNAPPTGYRWSFNGAALANNTHFAGTTTATLWITNVQSADAGVYSVAVTNAAGYVIPSATLTVTGPPANVVVTPANQSKLWGENASFSVTASGATPFTYQWKKGGVDLVDGGNISGATANILTLAAITRANEGSYNAGVTNLDGGSISSAGVLTVLVPPPTFSAVALAGTDLLLSFTSTNIYDTTNAFILQSSPVVEGPYTNSPASFIFTNNAFQVTVPQVGGNMFYRLLHVE
jgi:hypothetical protein